MPSALAEDTGIVLQADPARVLARLFVPGQEFAGVEDPKRTGVAGRVLGLDVGEVAPALAHIVEEFGDRHGDLGAILRRHGTTIAARVIGAGELSDERLQLLGAAFTCEQSIEGAAICNPSMVPHPSQANLTPGSLRVAMTIRSIGEGHLSSISFRSGVVDADGTCQIDAPEPGPVEGTRVPQMLDRASFHHYLATVGQDGESAASVLDRLGTSFSVDELGHALQQLRWQPDNPIASNATAERLQSYAERHWSVSFSHEVALSRRVLMPASGAEARGIEDCRMVRCHFDETARYLATYAAYDGHQVSQQLLESDDLQHFSSSPLLGDAATNKGMALFPELVGGRHLALSRHDRESNSLATSDDGHRWTTSTPLEPSTAMFESIQVGNCGSPIRTSVGWVALTHGVGPMRTYTIGAMLLDLDDPSKVLGRLDRPLLSASAAQRDGYVPNVVYSCGGLVHEGNLVVPYGIADSSIGVAVCDLDQLLAQLTR